MSVEISDHAGVLLRLKPSSPLRHSYHFQPLPCWVLAMPPSPPQCCSFVRFLQPYLSLMSFHVRMSPDSYLSCLEVSLRRFFLPRSQLNLHLRKDGLEERSFVKASQLGRRDGFQEESGEVQLLCSPPLLTDVDTGDCSRERAVFSDGAVLDGSWTRNGSRREGLRDRGAYWMRMPKVLRKRREDAAHCMPWGPRSEIEGGFLAGPSFPLSASSLNSF